MRRRPRSAIAVTAVLILSSSALVASSPTHADPVPLAAAPGLLAYAASGDQNDIRTIRSDDTGDSLLADEPDATLQRPAFSPDGLRVAYSSHADGRTVVRIVDLDDPGSPVEVPVPAPAAGEHYRHPVFSPDGRYLAMSFYRDFVSTPLGWVSTSAITVVDLETGEHTRFGPFTETVEDRVYHTLDAEPTFSPDGNRIAFSRRLQAPQDIGIDVADPDSSHIYVVDFAFPFTGTEPVLQASFNPCSGEFCYAVQDHDPAWSPVDSDRLVFARDGASLELLGLDPPARQTIPLTGTWSDVGRPAWSPDGGAVAFHGTSDDADASGIWTFPTSYGDVVAPAELVGGGSASTPTWQPFADLAVSLAGPGEVGFGATATVTVTVVNQGVVTATPILALDLGPGLAVSAVRPGPGACTPVVDQCTGPPTAPGTDWVIEVDVTGTAVGGQMIVAEVSAEIADSNPTDNLDRIQVTVQDSADLAVAVAPEAVVGYLGGTTLEFEIIVRNGSSSSTAGDVEVHLTVPESLAEHATTVPDGCATDAGCPMGDIGPGEEVTVTLRIDPVVATTGTVTATADSVPPDPAPADNTASARLRILTPRLSLNPPLGPPGKVTTVTGRDFPAHTDVVVAWDQGIPQTELRVTTDADGEFSLPILVFSRDRLGVRVLTATAVDDTFGPVTVDYLVVHNNQEPPGLGRD